MLTDCTKIFRLMLLLITLIPVLSYADWGDAIEIYTGAETADLAIDRNNGNIHIVCYKVDNGLIYTKTDPDGKILEQEPIPGAGDDEGGYRFSSTIAVDTQGFAHVTYRIYIRENKYDGYYTYKTASGWSAPLKLFSNTERGNQMRMAIDDNNRVHIIYPKYLPGSDACAKISYLRIKNGVKEYELLDMTGANEHRVQDHIEIDVSRSGDVYFVLGNPAEGQQLMCFRSTDGGNSFHYGIDIRGNTVTGTRYVCGSPDVFVSDEQNTVHFCYGADRDSEANYNYSLRYARFVNGERQRDVLVTDPGGHELDSWQYNYGIGSVGTSDDGKYVMIVYSKKSGGQLRWRLSEDFGTSFGFPTPLEEAAGGYDGRDKAKVRGYFKRFYAVYTRSSRVFLRIFTVPGFKPPVAHAGGPYNGKEGTPVTFNASRSTDDKGIKNYEWDLNNDGTFDFSATTPTAEKSFDDEYSGKIRLRVTDVDGMQDVAETTVNITNANPAPDAGGNITNDEGVTINFSVAVNDPGKNDTHTFLWNFGDGNTSTQQNPTHAFGDNGSYQVTVTVRDNDGGQGQAQLTAKINNVKPTAEAGGPYNGSVAKPVNLVGSATDPGGINDPLEYHWDLDNDGTYEKAGQTVPATFNTSGTFTVKLRVRDDDSGVGFDEATVNIGKAAPVIANIPAQIVNEGTPFPVLDLDEFVEDLDTPDNQLTWSFKGNDSLSVELDAATHEVSVEVPYDEWSGTEKVTFTVKDPDQLSDEAVVTFTVKPVNDPPVLMNFSDQYFAEDDTLILYRSNLVALVSDPDNGRDDFRFSIANNTNVLGYYDTQIPGLKLYGKPNWNGNERLALKVEDGAGGSDTKDFTAYVTPQPDPPLPFTLVSPINEVYKMWPASIQFNWNSTTDPDRGEKVSYQWLLSRSADFQALVAQSPVISANSYTYNDASGKAPGLFYWRVEATGTDGLKTMSTNHGVLNLNSKAPRINKIANQTIDEGGEFRDIPLNNYVSDEDNSKDELVWSYTGNEELIVEISEDKIASIKVPHDKWWGEEHVSFIVTDPTSLSDTAKVTFKVNDVNAKPVLGQVPNQVFDEDAFKILNRSFLEGLATDEDNTKEEFKFRLVNNVNVTYQIGPNGDMTLSAAPNWAGEEMVALVVDDGAGASDSSNFKVTVNEVPDAPSAFNLISPKDNTLFMWMWPMKFMWEKSEDPDQGDAVSYYWQLSRSTNFATDNNPDIIDAQPLFNHPTNFYNYMSPKMRMPKGTYYWKLTAFDQYGNVTECNDGYAMFSTMMDDVESLPTGEKPKDFALLQNHPNPFNPETHIQFELPRKSLVQINVYNALGQKVRELVNTEMVAGRYSVSWDALDDTNNPVSSGIYLCLMRVENKVFYRKMLLLQ